MKYRRLTILAIVGVLLAGAAFGPRLAASYHLWSLRRMSPAALERYHDSHESDLDAAYVLGMRYAQTGRLREAGAMVLSVFQSDPTRIRVLNDYAVILMAQRRYLEAQAALEGLLKVDPGYAAAWANLGRLHILTQMPFTAAQDLEKAVHLDGSALDAYRDLGTAYQQSTNYAAALKAFQAALRIAPNDAAAGVGLAQVYETLSKPEEAQKAIEEVVKRHPHNADALATLGDFRLKRAVTHEEIENALVPLRQSVALNPNDASVLFNLGVALRRLGRNEEAVQVLKRDLKVSPGYPAALYQLSQALLGAGHTAEGERLGEQFRVASQQSKLLSGLKGRIGQNPRDYDARLRLARFYLSQRHYFDSALQCRELLAMQPGNKDARRLLVRVALAAEYSAALSAGEGPGAKAKNST